MPRKASTRQAKEQATLSFDTSDSGNSTITPVEDPNPIVKPEPNVISVSELDERIKNSLDNPELNGVIVTGEITGLKINASGHYYFSLTEKDNTDSSISCVIWKYLTKKLPFPLKDGTAINATGRVDFYAPSGRIQFIISKVEPAFAGKKGMYLQKEEWEKQLKAEGVIPKPEEEKRPLPLYPRRIGIVTSRTGSVLQDIRNVISRRFPSTLMLATAQVQGTGAEVSIVSAIRALQDKSDVIIVARGGGSFEDLFIFNHPDVVRAIRNSTVPIISAIGHETDFTLADCASDVRAPTPSAAAENVVRDRMVIYQELEIERRRMHDNVTRRIHVDYERVSELKIRIDPSRLTKKLDTMRQQTSEMNDRIVSAIKRILHDKKEDTQDILEHITRSIFTRIRTARLELDREKERIISCDPKKPLERGYAMIQKNGSVIRSTRGLNINDRLNIRLADGSIIARVDEIANSK